MTCVSKLKFVRYLWKFCNFFVLRLFKLFAFLYAALARGRSGHPCYIQCCENLSLLIEEFLKREQIGFD